MTPETFRTMRQGWFWEALQAYQEEQQCGRRHIGELVRGATLILRNIQVEPKDRIREAEKFWPMPWDGKKSINEEEIRKIASMTDEERAQNAKAFMDRIGWSIEDGTEES